MGKVVCITKEVTNSWVGGQVTPPLTGVSPSEARVLLGEDLFQIGASFALYASESFQLTKFFVIVLKDVNTVNQR